MASELHKLDPEGFSAFRKVFGEKITPPSTVYQTGENAMNRFFGVAVASLCFVIIVIAVGILFVMIYAEWITISIAVGMFVFILFSFWLGYLLFKSVVDTELNVVLVDMNSHIGTYGNDFMENLLAAVKEGANAYVKGKKKRTIVEEVFEPVD